MLSILYLHPSIKFQKNQDNIYTCEPIREFDLNGSRSRWILNINNNKQTIKIHNHHSEMFENHAEFGPRSFFLTLYHLRIRWQPLGTISILGSECNDFRNVFFIWRMNGRLGSSKIHFAGNLQKYAECIHWNFCLISFQEEIWCKRSVTLLFLGFRCLDSRLEYKSDRMQRCTLPEIDRNEAGFEPRAFLFIPFYVRIRWHHFYFRFQMPWFQQHFF